MTNTEKAMPNNAHSMNPMEKFKKDSIQAQETAPFLFFHGAGRHFTMPKPFTIFCLLLGIACGNPLAVLAARTQPIIVDHRCVKLASIPDSAIQTAKSTLHIAYGHTSHGSQLTTGMTGLVGFKGPQYAWNAGGAGGALDLNDTPFSGASDLGNPDRTAWEAATRNYLASHPHINVIIWSWCGQVSSATEADITNYLDLMNGLERDFPRVTFVYMTGHLDGTGLTGNLHLRNEQIRTYCRNHNKVLYDFADIQSYNPDGAYFGDKIPNDACDYDSDHNGSRDRNWAVEWQDSHARGVDWYDCSSAHSEPLNANMKAYAAWWLWAQIAGWAGMQNDQPPAPVIVSVYPNPANTQVTFALKSDYNDQVKIILLNASGERVLKVTADLVPPSTLVQAATSQLGPGVYFYQVYGRGGKAGGGKVCVRH